MPVDRATARRPAAIVIVAIAAAVAGCYVGPHGPWVRPEPVPYVVEIEPVLHCSEDDVLACFALSRQARDDADDTRRRRIGVQVDDAYAALLERCSAGIDEACYEAAWLGIEGYTTTNVSYLAYELMNMTCARGHGPACVIVSLSDRARNRAVDAAAMQLCSEGHTYACIRLADRVIRDAEEAGGRTRGDLTPLVLACDQGFSPMCNELGYALEADPEADEEGVAEALSYYRRACDLGDGDGCWNAAWVLEETARAGVRTPEEVEYFARGCRLGDGPSCDEVGRSYVLGMGVAEDEVVALAWYETACDLGSGAGCANAGRMLQAVAETDEAFYDALDAFDRACLQGYDVSCSDAAWAARDEPSAISID